MTNSFKVLFVCPVPHFKGGAEQSLLDLVRNPNIVPSVALPSEGAISEYLHRNGVDFHIVDYGSVLKISRPFQFTDGIKSVIDAVKAAMQLKRISKSYDVDVIHSNGLKAHVISILSRMLGASPTVVHVRDIPYTRQEKIFWKLLARLSTKIVFVSSPCWPEDKLPKNGVVVPNGVDIEGRVVLDPVPDVLRLGFIARLHPMKGLHVLLEWVAFARSRNVNIELFVRGVFSEDAPQYESEIDELVSKLDLKNFVRFEGFISDRRALYSGIDAVASVPVAAEPFARTCLEPLGLGIPVIATAVGGNTEMVIDRKTGLIVNDAETFLQAVTTLLSRPEDRDAMIDAGMAHAASNFSTARLHSNINGVYKSVISPAK